LQPVRWSAAGAHRVFENRAASGKLILAI